MDQPAASIIIPTFNRDHYLALCLSAVGALETDHQSFEIIVVDNNSTDNTREVVRRFGKSHPTLRMRYVTESKQGVSATRNRGIAEARASNICIIDDDAVPSPHWLNAISEGFADPKVGCVGGPLIPDYQGQMRPSWLKGDLQGLVGGFVLKYDKPTPVKTAVEFPWGGNMSFRHDALQQVGQFREDLGPIGDSRLIGEETELMTRLDRAGWKILYHPGAVCRHFVLPKQVDKSFIYREAKVLAATHVNLTLDHRPHMIARWFASDTRYAMRLFLKLLAALAQRKPLWFDDYIRFWIVMQRIPIRARALFHRQYSRRGLAAQMRENR